MSELPLNEQALEALILSSSDEVEAAHRAGKLGRSPTVGYLARAAMRLLVKKLGLEPAPSEKLPLSFRCPDCGKRSYHPRDIEERYCGHCYTFVDDEVARRQLAGKEPS